MGSRNIYRAHWSGYLFLDFLLIFSTSDFLMDFTRLPISSNVFDNGLTKTWYWYHKTIAQGRGSLFRKAKGYFLHNLSNVNLAKRFASGR